MKYPQITITEDVKIPALRIQQIQVPTKSVAVRTTELPKRYSHLRPQHIKEPFVAVRHRDEKNKGIEWMVATPLPDKAAVNLLYIEGFDQSSILGLTFFHANWKCGKTPRNIMEIDIISHLLGKGCTQESMATFSGRMLTRINDLTLLSRDLSEDLKVRLRESKQDYSLIIFRQISFYPAEIQVKLWDYIHENKIENRYVYQFLLKLREFTGVVPPHKLGKGQPKTNIVFPQGADLARLISTVKDGSNQ